MPRKRIAPTHITFLKSIKEPRGIKRRNIRSSACRHNHRRLCLHLLPVICSYDCVAVFHKSSFSPFCKVTDRYEQQYDTVRIINVIYMDITPLYKNTISIPNYIQTNPKCHVKNTNIFRHIRL